PAWIRERLDYPPISAAERRNVARQPQPELVVKEAEVSAHDRLRGYRPGGAQARRDISLGHEFRIVVPADSEIQREITSQLPIVLSEQPVVIVPQMDLVSF